MQSRLRDPLFVFALVLLWRALLLIFTVQPIPENDAFGYDGAIVNFLNGGGYYNPSMAVVFPVSGTEIYSTYPPLYQGVLLLWMKVFGTSVISAGAMHLVLFAISGSLVLAILKKYFPGGVGYALAVLFFFGLTFDDRPEGLAFNFGLASLWLVARQISREKFCAGTAVATSLALLLCLYTSVIVGAYFFGAGFLACATACLWRRNFYWFAPFVAAAALFVMITFSIAKLEPRWWAGFMESARQQSVVISGFHAPHFQDLIKLTRTVPVFVMSLALVPLVFARRKEIFSVASPWLAIITGVFFMGWVLLGAAVMLLAPNYVNYAIFTQIILACGLLALARKHFPAREHLLRMALLGCVLLASIRAVGITTWGVASATKNSYQDTQAVLHTELAPYVTSEQPVLLSSAFLYDAVGMGVKKPIHADWYFDHASWTNNAEFYGMIRLQPRKLLLTQFDYFRAFILPLDQLRQHPELVDIHVRNLAKMPAPDSIPSLCRVIQHISWAPVIVDLDWKHAPSP